MRDAFYASRRRQGHPCFVHPAQLLLRARRAPLRRDRGRCLPRASLVSSQAPRRLCAAALTLTSLALRQSGHPAPAQATAWAGVALAASLVATRQRLESSPPPPARPAPAAFAGSRASWDEETPSEPPAPRALASPAALLRQALTLARGLLSRVVLPLLHAARVLWYDVRSAASLRPSGDKFFSPEAPTAPKRERWREVKETKFKWTPPPAPEWAASARAEWDKASKGGGGPGAVGSDGLTEEERQVKILADAAKSAAKGAADVTKGAAEKAERTLRGFLRDFEWPQEDGDRRRPR